jgi:hypothetical protein
MLGDNESVEAIVRRILAVSRENRDRTRALIESPKYRETVSKITKIDPALALLVREADGACVDPLNRIVVHLTKKMNLEN